MASPFDLACAKLRGNDWEGAMQDETPRRRRSGGRAGNTRRSSPHVIQQSPWRMPVNVDRPTEPLSEDGVARLHDTAMRILEEIGIEFLNEEALELRVWPWSLKIVRFLF